MELTAQTNSIATTVNMTPTVKLTPAQIVFLESSIQNFRADNSRVELAGQAASTRRFFRVRRDDESYILVEWDSGDEDWPRFLGVESYVSSVGVDMLPKIFANDPTHGLILEEDLGAVTLKKFCADNHGNISAIENMYMRVIDTLYKWHNINVKKCQHITSRSMDVQTFLWESVYFARHCITEFFGKENLLDNNWDDERRRMANVAANLPKVNMHRDFQSENVMIHNDRIRFVDFQGARLGPALYDAASLLYDPYITQLNDRSTEKLLDYYFAENGRRIVGQTNADPSSSKKDFHVCAAQRLMQALGAYCNLSIHKGKTQYRQFIPTAVERLSRIFELHLPEYRAMNNVVENLQLEQTNQVHRA